jgi:hypothetical protein
MYGLPAGYAPPGGVPGAPGGYGGYGAPGQYPQGAGMGYTAGPGGYPGGGYPGGYPGGGGGYGYPPQQSAMYAGGPSSGADCAGPCLMALCCCCLMSR